jgi:hypothetical protein
MRCRDMADRMGLDLEANHLSFRPGCYALGSIESRAAARALAHRLTASRGKLRVVVECIGNPKRNWEFVVPMPQFYLGVSS